MKNEFLELTELKKALNERGIEYTDYAGVSGMCKYVYVFQEPDGNGYMRISRNTDGYYVRRSGWIHEDLSLEKVLEMAEALIAR